MTNPSSAALHADLSLLEGLLESQPPTVKVFRETTLPALLNAIVAADVAVSLDLLERRPSLVSSSPAAFNQVWKAAVPQFSPALAQRLWTLCPSRRDAACDWLDLALAQGQVDAFLWGLGNTELVDQVYQRERGNQPRPSGWWPRPPCPCPTRMTASWPRA